MAFEGYSTRIRPDALQTHNLKVSLNPPCALLGALTATSLFCGGTPQCCKKARFVPLAMLQLYLLMYQLLHVGRCKMQEPRGRLMHLSTFRRHVLKVGARIVQHARNIKIQVAGSAVAACERFWKQYRQLQWRTIPCRC